MKVKILVGALVLLVVMNLAALGSFWYMQSRAPRPHSGWSQDDGNRERRYGVQDMSREERRRLLRTMQSFRDEVRPLKEQTRQLEADLVASMREDPVPRARIDSLLQAISNNRLEIARRATDHMIALGDSLSPTEREHVIDVLMRLRPNRPGDRPGRRSRGRDNN